MMFPTSFKEIYSNSTPKTLSDYSAAPPGVCQLSLGSHLKKDTEGIEHVQKFALKLWYCRYYNLLTNITTLAFRRQQLKVFLNCCSPFPDSPAARRASPYRTSIRSTNSAIHIYCHDPLPTPISFSFPLCN